LVFVLMRSLALFQEVMVLVVWSGEFAGGQFARRSPPRAHYGDGRSRSFELERRDGSWSSFRGFGPPPVREGWFPHSGYCRCFRPATN
jgi:hypothetical protein